SRNDSIQNWSPLPPSADLARGGSSLPSVRLGDGSLRREGSTLAVEEIGEIPVSSRLALT
ncbi:unnamed protein product, partial [Musa banksii]